MNCIPLRDKTWRGVAYRIRKAPGIFLFLDYDGTLTPIVKTPAQAKASKLCRNIIRRLAALPGVRVAVVSGRTVSDLDGLLGVREVFRMGVHGLELAGPGRKNASAVIPRGQWEERLDVLKRELDLTLAGEAGVIIEDKGLALALHYRMVRPDVARNVRNFFKDQFIKLNLSDRYELLQGKKVIEARPRGFNKGTGVLRLLDEHGRRGDLVIYAGDDRTDEDAFGVLKRPAVTIRVGGLKKNTLARYRVGSPAELIDRLEDTAMIREAISG